jgi:uncharacterized protein DUF998
MIAAAVTPTVRSNATGGTPADETAEGRMRETPKALDGRAVWLAWGAVAGVVVFNLGWLVAGAVQGDGYSVASHDVSDLAALTARSPWVMLTSQFIAGTLIILFALFALFALRPALAVPGRGTALGALLLAASLIGLDNLSDAFFRLDCRAADPGCTTAAAASLWPGAHGGRSGQRHRHGHGPIRPRRPDASGRWLA